MSLKEEDRKVIVALELEKVDKTWMQIDTQIQAGLWDMAASKLTTNDCWHNQLLR